MMNKSTEDKDEVAAYINAVKAVFEDKSETYDEFLKILNNFKAETIDATYAKARFTKLFKGHEDLILGFNKFIPDNYEIILPLDKQPQDGDFSAFIKLVEHEFVDKKDKLKEFLQIMKQICAPRVDSKDVKARVNELFKGHAYLMLGFNQFLPTRCQNPLRFEDEFYKCGQRKKKVPVTDPLPWDVLDNISKRLDFDDLVQFSGVCKYWRAFYKIYWRNFLASQQEPLLIQRCFNAMKSFSFISITDQTVYHSKTINCFWRYAYSGSSSGYMIMTGENNNFVLLNPFTRIRKEIKTSAFEVNCSDFAYHVLLAFVKGSEEFVLVVLCKSSSSLHVYQSRNLGWVTYSTMGNPWKVVDFVVLNNIIYVITDMGNIGTLNLNNANIKFLELKNTPQFGTFMTHLRLVTCDGQLLVVFTIMFGRLRVPWELMKVYRIDFSTMNYVHLKTLGDIALFYASRRNCYALSNPGKLGYESNSLYFIDASSTKCKVYTRGNTKKIYSLNHHMKRPYLLDWCFRHLPYEIDYSLVE